MAEPGPEEGLVFADCRSNDCREREELTRASSWCEEEVGGVGIGSFRVKDLLRRTGGPFDMASICS